MSGGSALVQAVPAALQHAGVSPAEIAGISVDATAATVLAVNDDGRPLRPAIMWMDVRASEQAERIADTGDPALKYSGFGAVSAEWGMPRVLWLKQHEPETYRNAAYLVECGDWLIHELTGKWTSSINIISCKYFYDRGAGGWPERLYQAVEGEDVLGKFPTAVLDVGVTRRRAAQGGRRTIGPEAGDASR